MCGRISTVSLHLAQRSSQQMSPIGHFATASHGSVPPPARWNECSFDGREGAVSIFQNETLGEQPVLGLAGPDSGAQSKQTG